MKMESERAIVSGAALLGLQDAGRARKPWIAGSIKARDRVVPVVSTRLSRNDAWGGVKVRWNIGRDRYSVLPGLYAAGAPATESPVLVTANYKLSFDTLRGNLQGIDAWILVLDTKGINVWCAAGKGTFGTGELERRVRAVKLDQIVSHRTLILPQLGAPGVSAPEVKKATGWTVRYGPVRAEDIRAYLSAGQKKDEAMRKVRFALSDRMAVAPVELTQAWPLLLGILAASALFGLPFSTGYAQRLLQLLLPLGGGVLAAVFGFPALLPYLPFRAFALKGAVLGIAWGIASALLVGASAAAGAGLVLLLSPIVAFIAMNFTGASTFTSQPGAALEVRRGIIPMAASLAAGIVLTVLARLFAL
jgi:hypothetical protein